MILREATIKYKGYDPKDLKSKSNKRICCSCDECGRVKWVRCDAYHDLCNKCSGHKRKGILRSDELKIKVSLGLKKYYNKNPQKKGKNSPLYGKKYGKETKKKQHDAKIGKTGEYANAWKGGISNDRSHLLLESQCIKLNQRFNNSEFHHLTRSYGVYIPKELHNHLYHNLKNGKNMKEINILAIQFINGGY